MLSDKDKKPTNTKSRNSKKLKIPPHGAIKKVKGLKKETPSDELKELAKTWDEDLCE